MDMDQVLNHSFLRQEENKKAEELIASLGIEGHYNYNSPIQVKRLIFVEMKCPIRKDTSDETLTKLINVNTSLKQEIARYQSY